MAQPQTQLEQTYLGLNPDISVYGWMTCEISMKKRPQRTLVWSRGSTIMASWPLSQQRHLETCQTGKFSNSSWPHSRPTRSDNLGLGVLTPHAILNFDKCSRDELYLSASRTKETDKNHTAWGLRPPCGSWISLAPSSYMIYLLCALFFITFIYVCILCVWHACVHMTIYMDQFYSSTMWISWTELWSSGLAALQNLLVSFSPHGLIF